ncbi:RNA polymerase I-specific transcription initiation factor RRN3 [Amniculicola lignicola CBS 123094]|uniref:RNA polymerase I-specific transcription initiation factor RRN3 n=1 Tax=Amniculicola lignicola CBS 123094 TaxID=1392246 RepID=A0A6A5W4B6_9PLEO|nr:RNA polymerase I-specific transcription initiation factor RRN3 [Amniculicola lignicola CBS 123094]
MVSLASTERARGVIAPGVGGSLKRKQSETTQFDADSLSSSQIKRRRVTFDPDVDVHILPDANEKSQELVAEEVRRALEKHADGDHALYNQIRLLLASSPTAADAPLTRYLQKYVIALTHNVPRLDHDASGLVHAVIDSQWIARGESYVRAYRHLLRSLVSVHPGYTSAVLYMLVNMFIELPSTSLRQQDDPPVQRPRLLARVHDTLKYILRQGSMTSTHLQPILSSTFPFPKDTTKAHVQYIKNILRVSEYCPELKGEIMSLVMDKLVKIDVQIQVDMDELDDEIEDRLVGEEGNDEDEEDDISDDESVSSDGSLDANKLRLKELKESVTKLDSIMNLLFSHYDSIFAKKDTFDIDDTFEGLLSQFASIILPTYRSRHTQFILFHFSQTSPDLMERFAGCCSHLAFDNRRAPILRVAAAAYLASFIARGAHVSSAIVRDVFDLLCHHLETERLKHESGCRIPDLSRYGTYYAIAQALLYTFCFRWRDLVVTPDGRPITDEAFVYHEGEFTWHNSIQAILNRNILSPLNPLKICAPTIVAQFARVAHHLRFIYVFNLLETNKRIRLTKGLGGQGGYMSEVGTRETALTQKRGEESLLLDAYFPFDPYVLPKSRRWLEGDYVEWRAIPGMEGSKDDEEEEEDSDEDSEDNGEDDDEDEESDSQIDRSLGRAGVDEDDLDDEEEEDTDSDLLP